MIDQYVEQGEFCGTQWFCEDQPEGPEVGLDCIFLNVDVLECTCFSGESFNTFRVESENVCFDIEFAESLVNLRCGSEIKFSGVIDG